MKMKLITSLSVAVLVAGLTGCDHKDEDAALAQGRSVFSKAVDLAGGAWKSACDRAQKLSANSGKSTIEAAKSQLEAVQEKMSHIKAPSNLDGLKLDSVKEEIQRLQAALTVKNLKEQMDERVKDAMKLKENAEKSAKDVQDRLAQADAQYQDLNKRLDEAQSAYNSAAAKVKDTTEKIKSL
jgi:chromosome segregation ATPase